MEVERNGWCVNSFQRMEAPCFLFFRLLFFVSFGLCSSAFQVVINDISHELTQRAPLSIRNPLKLSFRFSDHSHTYGV